MKFEIRKSKMPDENGQEWWYVLKGSNGEVMMTSEMLSSKQNCYNSISSIKQQVGPVTRVIDTTV